MDNMWHPTCNNVSFYCVYRILTSSYQGVNVEEEQEAETMGLFLDHNENGQVRNVEFSLRAPSYSTTLGISAEPAATCLD